jgi:hypothetical protein
MGESAQELFEKAQQGQSLTPRERRKVVDWVDSQDELDYSNTKLAEIFGVSEGNIRHDKKLILKAYASAISPEMAMTYVGHYLKSHDDLIRKARFGLFKTKVGTVYHQNYLKVISDLEDRKKKLLQEIGIIPKELGSVNIFQEVWQATVSDGGVTSVVPVDVPDPVVGLLEAEILDGPDVSEDDETDGQ